MNHHSRWPRGPTWRRSKVTDETNGGAAVDQDHAKLLLRQAAGLLQHAVTGERQERQGGVKLPRVDAWHGLPLGLRHPATVSPVTRSTRPAAWIEVGFIGSEQPADLFGVERHTADVFGDLPQRPGLAAGRVPGLGPRHFIAKQVAAG